LDKHDYSIRRLEDVDDKRVDDIIISRKTGHWWLTANKKMYEYGKGGRLLDIYPASDKYIFRLHEDEQGVIWATEWEGGVLQLKDGHFIQVHPENDSLDFRRMMTDKQGRQLIADGFGKCYALEEFLPCKRPEVERKNGRIVELKSWFNGEPLTKAAVDSIRIAN
jgi:hypothetical protein